VAAAFRGQGGDALLAPGGLVPWWLQLGSRTVASGTLYQGGLLQDGAGFVTAAHRGEYRLITDGPPYRVGGLAGRTRVEATFDTTRTDPNPPSVASFGLRHAGRLTDTVPRGGALSVQVAARDEALPTVTIAYGTPFVSVPALPASGGLFEATIADPCHGQAGGVPLRITITDPAGNVLRQTFEPGFTCVSTTCGDDRVDPQEQCDDGNTASGDGCNATCTSNESCGNGILDPAETCDDGGLAPGDGCSAACARENACGDGVLELGEQCDDGNASEDDCTSTCTLVPRCGDGIVTQPEQCERVSDADCCSAACTYDTSCYPTPPPIACTNVPDGSPCDDGSLCTSGDTCRGGYCRPGPPCRNDDPCTVEQCTPSGCSTSALACYVGLDCRLSFARPNRCDGQPKSIVRRINRLLDRARRAVARAHTAATRCKVRRAKRRLAAAEKRLARAQHLVETTSAGCAGDPAEGLRDARTAVASTANDDTCSGARFCTPR
jgi:cysteine-rich repeat protein